MSKILIIDDDVQLCRVVGEFLADHGHDVATATDGLRGLAEAKAVPPDLILCDLDMPGASGQEVVVRLRQDEQLAETPVIYLSGCADASRIRQSMNVGGDDFIGKPAPYPVILDAVESRLGRQQKTRQRQSRRLKQTVEAVASIIFDLDANSAQNRTLTGGSLSAEIVAHLNSSFGLGGAATAAIAGKDASAILVKDRNRRHFLKLSDVKALIAFGEYSRVYWGDRGENIMFRKPLKKWEQELPAGRFVRVHRKAIINLAFLELVEKRADQKLNLRLRGFPEMIEVSQRGQPRFNRQLKQFAATQPQPA